MQGRLETGLGQPQASPAFSQRERAGGAREGGRRVVEHVLANLCRLDCGEHGRPPGPRRKGIPGRECLVDPAEAPEQSCPVGQQAFLVPRPGIGCATLGKTMPEAPGWPTEVGRSA